MWMWAKYLFFSTIHRFETKATRVPSGAIRGYVTALTIRTDHHNERAFFHEVLTAPRHQAETGILTFEGGQGYRPEARRGRREHLGNQHPPRRMRSVATSPLQTLLLLKRGRHRDRSVKKPRVERILAPFPTRCPEIMQAPCVGLFRADRRLRGVFAFLDCNQA